MAVLIFLECLSHIHLIRGSKTHLVDCEKEYEINLII